jgi:hypothetical protein
MKPVLTHLAFILASDLSFAEDAELRQDALRLLERAHAVSLAPNLPNLERSLTLRASNPGSADQEGAFTHVVVQGTGRRDEVTCGDYHVINAVTGPDTCSSPDTQHLKPDP